MLRPKSVVSQRRVTTIVAPLALVLSMSISHSAMATCLRGDPPATPTVQGAPTDSADAIVCNATNPPPEFLPGDTANTKIYDLKGGDDVLTVEGTVVFANGGVQRTNGTYNTTASGSGTAIVAVKGGDGNDTFNINGGEFRGQIQGNADNDLFTFKGGEVHGAVQGNAGDDVIRIFQGTHIYGSVQGDTSNSSSDTGSDLIVVFGGQVNGELQGNRGTDTIAIFGGTTGNAETGDGDGDRIFLDGGTVSGLEINNGSTNNRIYLRSGSVGEIEAESVTNDTFIIDPIHSVIVSDALRNATSIGAFNSALSSAAINTEAVLTFTEEEFETGQGDDKITFQGAVNFGEGRHNIKFAEDDFEWNGGDGYDVFRLDDESSLKLGEIEDFEYLRIDEESTLVLTEEKYKFSSASAVAFSGSTQTAGIRIDGSSVLWFTNATEVEAPHITIGAPDGNAEEMKVSDQYAAFDPGGVLMFGNLPSGGEEEEDEVSALEEEEEEAETGPVNTVLKIGPSTLVNDGTIGTLNSIVGDTVTVDGGGYESAGGNMVLDSTLGGTGSPSDKFVFTSSVSGVTTVYVNNVGGTGAYTGHGATDGILIIESTGPGFASDAFMLATNLISGREEVIAGAFSYQIVNDGTSARLQSDILDQVPAYTAAASVAQRWASSGLGTLYKRLGEVRLGKSNDRELSGGGTVWARGLYGDYDVDPKSGFGFSQRNDGVLMGADANIEDEDGGHLMFGLFGGYGTADADVAATIWGAGSKSRVELTAWSVGAYGTYYEHGRPGTGLYVDGVFKADILDVDMSSVARSTTASTDGYAATVSGEMGYGVPLGGNLTLQPQAQLSYTTVALTNYSDSYGIDVGNGNSTSLVGRASLQMQGNYSSGSGWFAPYVIASVLSDFLGENQTTVGGTPFTSDVGLTWFEAGGGVTAQVGESLSLYGSAEYSFGDVQGWGGTGGIKARW